MAEHALSPSNEGQRGSLYPSTRLYLYRTAQLAVGLVRVYCSGQGTGTYEAEGPCAKKQGCWLSWTGQDTSIFTLNWTLF